MIPTNITRPQDLAAIFAVFALVVVTIGFGISGAVDNYNYTGDVSFYQNVSGRVTDASGLKGSADSVSEGLIGQEGASEIPSQEGILLQGFNSIRQIGANFQIMSDSLSEGVLFLGIPVIYWTIYTSILLLSFAVVMYNSIFGRGT